LWFVAHDQKLSEFAINLLHELAWPLLLLVLLGYSYRESLNRLLNRIFKFKVAGMELEAGAETMPTEEKEYLRSKLDGTGPEDRKRIETLLTLSPAALRLLGNVVAVGHSQNLNLTLYKSPRFERGKRKLLDAHLVVLDGQYYRPTLEGVRVFSFHVEALKEKMASPEKRSGV